MERARIAPVFAGEFIVVRDGLLLKIFRFVVQIYYLDSFWIVQLKDSSRRVKSSFTNMA